MSFKINYINKNLSLVSYTYFGARYYDSDLSGWLSVDPMSDERRWVSPYAYCQWNPLILVDPSGMLDWEPVVTKSGDVKYIAEKGDNIYTFISQYNLSFEQAKNIFENAGISNPVNSAGFGKAIKPGTEISGDAVKKATGSEILKGQFGKMTKGQIASQIIFAIAHSKLKGDWYFDLKDYMDGFQIGKGGVDLSNFKLTPSYDNIPIINLSIGCTYEYTKIQNYPVLSSDDIANKFIYDFRTAAGEGIRPMIMFTIDKKYYETFEKIIKL